MAQTYQILIVLFIIFISLIMYWNSQIHKSKKFIYLMQLVGTMGILLAVYNIHRDSENDKQNYANEKTRLFSETMNNLINQPNELVLSNDSLKKYYLELIGQVPERENDPNRDQTSEILLSVNIFSALAQVIEYIYSHQDIRENAHLVSLLNERIKKIMTQYLKNKKFREYWELYKGIYSGDIIVNYMSSNFGI